jgi:predicted ABC-type transport system involved in lysophospholipase L1 biosynthesis ATPase subunit
VKHSASPSGSTLIRVHQARSLPRGASRAGACILDLIARIRRERGVPVVLVTHDAAVAARADRIGTMLDGRAVPAAAAPEEAAVASAGTVPGAAA